jgi:glycosyltransferase involved in cell wall biosynthesis
VIIIIAAYSPIHESETPSLGAARKIESVISVLHKIDNNIILINSAHNKCVYSGFKQRNIIINDIKIKEITLPTKKNRKIGKFLNIIHIFNLLKMLSDFKNPKLIWIYNGYLFESLFAVISKRVFNCPFILEFEDWHFSRTRYISIKTALDFLASYCALKNFSLCFAVNNFLLSKVKNKIPTVHLLPGIVSSNLLASKKKIPFIDVDITVGYFGGLDFEKGFDVVLALIKMQLPGFKFVVCGAGDSHMEILCKNLASLYPQTFIFYGRVGNYELYELIGRCDVVLNPHKSIEKMKDGVFPFKVIEAIGSGRLVISTPLPILVGYEEIMRGVYYVEEASADSFSRALKTSRSFFKLNKCIINISSQLAVSEFGESALLTKVKNSIVV